MRYPKQSKVVVLAWSDPAATAVACPPRLSHGVKEREYPDTPTVSYTRGTDLSGSLEGAGGIGGLLARSHGYSAGNWTNHNYYHADGNGSHREINPGVVWREAFSPHDPLQLLETASLSHGEIITYLVNSSQAPAASYRYDPYGNTISSSGSLSRANTYRFSSKEVHVNSGLYYYGYRWYAPNLQRWPNPDPLGERGGLNLYEMLANDPVNSVDAFGLEKKCCCACVTSLEIKNVQKYTSGNLYGRKFDVVVGLKYIENGEGDAQLKWEEASSRPPDWQNQKPGEWYDMYARFPKTPTFNAWNNRKQPCPGTETVTITDEPAASLLMPARTLDFKITVKSGEKCKCDTKSLTVTAKQVLEPTTDSPPKIKTQEFTTP